MYVWICILQKQLTSKVASSPIPKALGTIVLVLWSTRVAFFAVLMGRTILKKCLCQLESMLKSVIK